MNAMEEAVFDYLMSVLDEGYQMKFSIAAQQVRGVIEEYEYDIPPGFCGATIRTVVNFNPHEFEIQRDDSKESDNLIIYHLTFEDLQRKADDDVLDALFNDVDEGCHIKFSTFCQRARDLIVARRLNAPAGSSGECVRRVIAANPTFSLTGQGNNMWIYRAKPPSPPPPVQPAQQQQQAQQQQRIAMVPSVFVMPRSSIVLCVRSNDRLRQSILETLTETIEFGEAVSLDVAVGKVQVNWDEDDFGLCPSVDKVAQLVKDLVRLHREAFALLHSSTTEHVPYLLHKHAPRGTSRDAILEALERVVDVHHPISLDFFVKHHARDLLVYTNPSMYTQAEVAVASAISGSAFSLVSAGDKRFIFRF